MIGDRRFVPFSQMNNFGNIVFPLHKIPVCEIAVTFPKLDNAKKCDILSLHKSTALSPNIPCRNTRECLESRSTLRLGDFLFCQEFS